MERNVNIFRKKTFVVITGASKGLGRSIAIHFAAKFPLSSVLVLMSRNLNALESVKSEIESTAPGRTVLVKQFDQGSVDKEGYFHDLFQSLLVENKLLSKDFDQQMIVHNCGDFGDVTKKAVQMSDTTTIRGFFDRNLTGMILLNSDFLKMFSDSTKSRIVINMSSLASVMPSASGCLYCPSKAARDMFFRVMAIEEPTVRILTYFPGVCETDMLHNLLKFTFAEDLKDLFRNIRSQGKSVSADTSFAKLVEILEENTFENAAIVDFDDSVSNNF